MENRSRRHRAKMEIMFTAKHIVASELSCQRYNEGEERTEC